MAEFEWRSMSDAEPARWLFSHHMGRPLVIGTQPGGKDGQNAGLSLLFTGGSLGGYGRGRRPSRRQSRVDADFGRLVYVAGVARRTRLHIPARILERRRLFGRRSSARI